MTHLSASLLGNWSPQMQISPAQAEVIGSVIVARGPACRLLVFGAGHDSALWAALNRTGETVIVEHDPAYAELARASAPGATLLHHDFGGFTTVVDAFSVPLSRFMQVPLPPAIAGPWDVILVDGPPGYGMDNPGRALPLFWTSRLMGSGTHVFVDDYSRVLERHFTDLFIRFDNPPGVVIPHELHAHKCMFWRIGQTIPRQPG